MSHGSVDLWKQNTFHTCMWIKTWQPHRRQRYSCALQNISSKHCTTRRSHCLSGAAPATKSAATVANEKFGPASTDRRASRGVILKGREVRGFLNDGMAGLYEVKREPRHMVEHLSKLAALISSLHLHTCYLTSCHAHQSGATVTDKINNFKRLLPMNGNHYLA